MRRNRRIVVTVIVRPVGQNYGCIGIVRDSRGRKLAETHVRPWGFWEAARLAAVDIVRQRGWELAEYTAEAP